MFVNIFNALPTKITPVRSIFYEYNKVIILPKMIVTFNLQIHSNFINLDENIILMVISTPNFGKPFCS